MDDGMTPLRAFKVDNPEHLVMGDDALDKKIVQFRTEWKNVEDIILSGLQNSLEMEFFSNSIDVHIVRSLRGGFSTPLVISAMVPTEYFADVLTHELVHVLINNSTKELNIRSIFEKLYGIDIPRLTRNHILVHAVHEDIFRNVLKSPERLQHDIEKSERHPEYKQAWDIVQERGYKNIIEEFKKECKK